VNSPRLIFLLSAIFFLLLIGVLGVNKIKPLPLEDTKSKIPNQRYTNRLVKEKSPYLLQHANNPVDWYPWGSEAFEKAKKEDRPIFLSIGYSTCHWCHVMEEEAFSNPEIAQIMNKYFVSIKVDREERPDLDSIYMNAVMTLTGTGGWPLNIFLTPDLKPFYGGTYFPPEDRWGRAGFKSILNSIANNWQSRKDKILDSAGELVDILKKQLEIKAQETAPLDKMILKKAYEHFYASFDAQYGGFGSAPKFPSGHQLAFLLRYWKRTKEPKALEIVEKTLAEIAKGGIYDHIGGGFHRYSTDQKWLLPHFEKMLYDQAILSRAYLEAFQATGKKEYAIAAREIFEYVLRDMAYKEGGFYSAEDADSPSPENPKEKREGAFYLWSKDEILNILGKEDGGIICYYFGIEHEGNVLTDPTGEFKAKNILHVAYTLEETAGYFKKPLREIEKIIADAKRKLFIARSQRPGPHLDDKILVDWNGLMISSLAFASRVLNEHRYCKAAEKSVQFILKNLQDKNGRLLHRYRDGEAAIKAMLDDYAFFIQGLLDLYEASFNPEYLMHARRLTQGMLELFWDAQDGGFFSTASDAERLFIRHKTVYDGAMPSGNSIAGLDLLRLARFFMDKELDKKAEAFFKSFSTEISRAPTGCAQTLSALDFAFGPSKEIVIAGDSESQGTRQMIKAVYQRFMPNKVAVFYPADKQEAQKIQRLIPFLENLVPLENKATAYVCENYVCKLPVTSVEKLTAELEN
jgi:uncharacterized protein YyaL (SSP411 family)